MQFRKILLSEIDRVMDIINDAKELLKSFSSLQWQQGYPNQKTMINDINNNSLYGAYDDNNLLVGIIALVRGYNDDYDKIYEGEFKTPHTASDLVIHRIAVKKEAYGRHIGSFMLKNAEIYAKETGCNSIKIDTHRLNKPMQKLCINNGYSYSGKIYLKRAEVDTERLLFEKRI